MHRFTQTIYLVLLRGLAALVMLACLMTFCGIPQSLSAGHFIMVPTLVTIINCLIALAVLLPRLTPRWLSHPSGALSGIGVGLAFFIAPFVFMLTLFSAPLIFGYGFDHTFTYRLGMMLNIISFAVCLNLWLTSLILAFWPTDRGSPSHNSGPWPTTHPT